jgi:hypothetical protein
MHSFARLTLALIFCFTVTVVAGQVKLSAIPSKTVIEQNEVLQLEFILEGATEVEKFIPPAFRNFEQLDGLAQSQGWKWVNGTLSEYVSYTVLLKPKIKGKLPIASAIIKSGGKTYSSNTVTIQVTDAVVNNSTVTEQVQDDRKEYYLKPGENMADKIRKNLFVKIIPDKKICYVGEPILATFKLFTRLNSESKIVKRPSLNGFSVIDLEEPESGMFTKEKVGDKVFDCYLIRKVQLFPLQPGVMTIEPIEVENIIRFIQKKQAAKNGKTSSWLDAVMEKIEESELEPGDIITEKAIAKSDSVTIKVLELPEKNKPSNFSGATGDLNLTAIPDKISIASNENGNLRIHISGVGNLSIITPPDVNWPEGLEAFSPKTNEVLDKHVTPLRGSKTVDIPFSAKAPGTYTIPPVCFSYFDYKAKTYKTVCSDSIKLTVTTEVLKAKKPVDDIIRRINNETAQHANVRWVAFGGVIAVIALLICLVLWRRFATKNKKIIPTELPEPVVEKKPAPDFLKDALYIKDSLWQKRFYEYLLSGVKDFINHRFAAEPPVKTNTAFAAALRSRGMFDEAVMFEQLVTKCEEILFSPVETEGSRELLLHETLELMKQVDEKLM